MLRGHLGPQSRNSMVMVTGWGIAHQSRRTEAGSAESQHDGYQNTNVWLRIAKRGNTVTSYVKKEGEYGYLRYHSVDVDLGPSYHVGLAVTMQNPLNLGTLEVENFEISDGGYSFPGVPVKIGTTANTHDNQVKVQEVGEGLWSINTGGTGIGVRSFFVVYVVSHFPLPFFPLSPVAVLRGSSCPGVPPPERRKPGTVKKLPRARVDLGGDVDRLSQ